MSVETKVPSDEIRDLAREAREKIHANNNQLSTASVVRSFLRERLGNDIMDSFDNNKPHKSRPIFPVYRRNNYGGTHGGPGKNRLPLS